MPRHLFTMVNVPHPDHLSAFKLKVPQLHLNMANNLSLHDLQLIYDVAIAASLIQPQSKDTS